MGKHTANVVDMSRFSVNIALKLQVLENQIAINFKRLGFHSAHSTLYKIGVLDGSIIVKKYFTSR